MTDFYVKTIMVRFCLLILDKGNLFNKDNNWENVNLNETPILFCTLTRQFISNSNIFKQKIEPLKDYQLPKYVIDSRGAGG